MDSMTEGMMKGPDGTILRFFYDPAKNDVASVAEGRAIFDTVLYVDVITPGQKSSTPRFELERVWSEPSKRVLGTPALSKKSHKYEYYREQIEQFKRNEHVGDLGGTPLKYWPQIDRGLAATLMAANVYTVEQLAGLSDANLDVVGIGARELREQAISFLAQAGQNAPVSALTDANSNLVVENQRLTQALALANQQLTELNRQIEQLTGKPTPEKKLVDITLP